MNNMHILSAMSILVFTHILVFAMGFVIAYMQNNGNQMPNAKINSFFDKQKKREKAKSIQIDDTKVVLDKDIKTNNLQKKFDKLGTNTKKKNDISSSVNKLKNMRG